VVCCRAGVEYGGREGNGGACLLRERSVNLEYLLLKLSLNRWVECVLGFRYSFERT
jgi:hypothetical protein